MYKSIDRAFLIFLIPGLLLAQQWDARYDGGGNDVMTAMTTDAAGYVYVTGYSTGSGTGSDFLTIKYDSHGDTVWTRRAGGTGEDSAFAIAVDGAGNVYVTGTHESTATGRDYLTIKYNSAGTAQWSQTYNNPSNGADRAGRLAVDAASNVYVTGTSDSAVTGSDFLTVKYNSAGVQQWAARWAGSGSDVAAALALDGTGDIYVAGTSWGGATPKFDYLVIKYSTATGDTIWTRRYDGTPQGNDYLSALALDGSGNVFACGASESTGTSIDFLTVKYSSAGELLWARRYDRNQDADSAIALACDAGGNVCVTGYAMGSDDEDYATVKYAPDGSRLWVKTYDDPNHNSTDIARAIALDAAGNVYLTGTCQGNSNADDVVTIKYDPAGATVWIARYDAVPQHNDDEGLALQLAAPGAVYVGGFSWGDNLWDYLTLKYFEHDAGIAAINSPSGTLKPYPVTPEVRVRNYGTNPEDVTVHVWVTPSGGTPAYYDVQTVYGLGAGDAYDVTFRTFIGSMGMYVVTCSLALPGDMNRSNDTARGNFTLQWTQYPYWFPQFSMPAGIKNKQVKSGGSLAYGQVYGSDNGTRYLWALKGNNTREFYRFHTNDGDTWHQLESIPCSPLRKKGVKNGAGIVYDRYDTAVYAMKGNNTVEFWKYDPRYNWWFQQDDVPPGLSYKNVKGGGAMVFYHTGSNGYVYALKGNKTRELWAFHVNGDSWFARREVPGGILNKGMGDGSCLVNAGGTFYALKGSYNEFYAYFPVQDSWAPRSSMPIVGIDGRKKKAKDGTALCYYGGDHVIYALKGGTNDFWGYFPAVDTWVPLTPLTPSSAGRVVKGGGSLAYGNGYAWALRGNRTNELWTYDPGNAKLFAGPEPEPGRPVVLSGGRLPAELDGLRILPNPTRMVAEVRLPSDMVSARMELYDISGKLVRTVPATSGGRAALDRDGLAGGVYLLKVVGSDRSLIRKVVFD